MEISDTLTISRDELKTMLDGGFAVTVVEVLPERVYRQGHLPSAINVPLLAMKHQAGEMLPDKNAQIVLYCLTPKCITAMRAVHLLRSMGYTNVREYAGGKEDWRAAGYPIEC